MSYIKTVRVHEFKVIHTSIESTKIQEITLKYFSHGIKLAFEAIGIPTNHTSYAFNVLLFAVCSVIEFLMSGAKVLNANDNDNVEEY